MSFRGRIESNDYSIIGVTEVKPKRLRLTINPAELALPGFYLLITSRRIMDVVSHYIYVSL